MNFGSANLEELLSDRPSVIVTHAMMGRECDVVSGLDLLAGSESYSVLLGDLFDEGLRVLDGRGLLVLESGRCSRCVLELGVESVLLSRTCLVGAVLGCGEGE